MAGTTIIQGYYVTPISLPGRTEVKETDGGLFSRYLYLKEHNEKDPDRRGKTLFVSNVPSTFDEMNLRALFEKFGKIKELSLKKNPDGYLANLAHIHFTTDKAVKKIIAASVDGRLKTASSENTETPSRATGLKRFMSEYYDERPRVSDLKEQVDRYLAAFEEKEAEEREERKRKATEKDADGFVTVTKRKRKKRSEVTDEAEKKRRKKKSKELKNFYRFQMREEKRSRLMLLREKFEEDKRRIEQMKLAKKFQPE